MSNAEPPPPAAPQPADFSSSPVVLEMRDIAKRFGTVTALDGVGFSLQEGEVHALLGENGAGKSTLVKIIAGAHRPDRGKIVLRGAPIEIRNPHHARKLGIACMYQETSLFPDLSVLENLFLGDAPRTRAGLLDWPEMRRRAARVFDSLGVTLNFSGRLGSMGKAQRQLVEIARALLAEARILIMDEPTAALTERETERLFGLVERLRDGGTAIIFISHRLEEIYRVASRVTVLRDGRLAGSASLGELTQDRLVQLMVGRKVEQLYPRHRREPGEVLLEVRGFSRPPGFRDVSFQVRSGEIVGLAGLVGSGRSEIARAIFGIDRDATGEVIWQGQPLAADPWTTLRRGIALVPEDRGAQGLLPGFSVARNLSLSSFDRIARHGFVSPAAETALAERFIDSMRIKPPRRELPADTLSGGNQQKVVIGRMLAVTPRLLLLDEPTQGIDVGAKAEVHALIDRLVNEGLGVLCISSDLPEVLGMADRILVMHRGRLAAEFPGGVTAETVMHAASGLTTSDSSHVR
ncbi:MAG: sugar ABC transporter ATP-binding protein [Verrucomicrobia bacterium]|nr:sugar ABC transporter ATP-binding protein [Verrucomicrobiota bacterium]